MSLVITSSTRDPTNVTTSGIGIQAPFSYQNTFRSPLLIKENSEVAVQSVRCNRRGYHFTNDGYYCVYFGKEVPDGESITADHVTNQPLYVRVEGGSYTKTELANELEKQLAFTLKSSYPNIIDVKVVVNTDAGLVKGFSFTTTQLGDGSAFTNTPDELKWIPTQGPLTRNQFGDDDLDPVLDSGSVSASGSEVTATEDFASAINTSYPLSLCKGTFQTDITKATNGFEVGLVRNLYIPDKDGAGGGLYANQPHGYQGNNNNVEVHLDTFYDFGVSWNPGETLKVFHYVADQPPLDPTNIGSLTQLDPLTVPTNASLAAGYYSAIEFNFVNEEISLKILHKDGTGPTNLVDLAVSGAANKLFKPTGLTTQALYPKIYIHKSGDSLTINKWNGISNTGNVFDFYANKTFGLGAENSGLGGRIVFDCDSNKVFQVNDVGDYHPTYTRQVLNASDGQANHHVTIFAENNRYDTILEGYLHTNLAPFLGFSKTIVAESDNPAVAANIYILKSAKAVDKFGTGSMFIRVNNLPFNSLNGATESISQILYACPRFDQKGNQEGPLYYEPNERTYVALKNSSEYILSDISVDIVDVNERVATDLDGFTVVILHIREAK